MSPISDNSTLSLASPDDPGLVVAHHAAEVGVGGEAQGDGVVGVPGEALLVRELHHHPAPALPPAQSVPMGVVGGAVPRAQAQPFLHHQHRDVGRQHLRLVTNICRFWKFLVFCIFYQINSCLTLLDIMLVEAATKSVCVTRQSAINIAEF